MHERKRKPTRPTPPAPEKILLCDREAAFVLAVGMTRLAELQREPDFPAPIWLGPRSKRHDRAALLEWLSARRRERAAA
jgi:predicted DNA-binding transcriptional regulator AlpA